MALSGEEQSVLDDIEQGLREDPTFTADLDPRQVARRRRRRALLVAVPGLLLLILGEMLAMSAVAAGVILSLTGFAWMLVAFAVPTAHGRPPGWSPLRRHRNR